MKKIIKFLYNHRYDIFLSIVLILLLLLLFFVVPQTQTRELLNHLENKSFDIRQNIISKDKKVNDDIVIITVDDPSYEYLIEEYGDWPVPRNVYAEILDYIQLQKPKYVLFDLLFIKSLNRIPHSDNLLINAFKKYSNTYTALNFDNYDSEMRQPPVVDNKIKDNIVIQSKSFFPTEFSNCRIIMPEIIDATPNIGHINTPKSDDGLTRSIPSFVNYKKDGIDNYYTYMTIKMAIDYFNKYENQKITELVVDKENNLLLGNRKIPMTSNGEIILNWYGKSGTETNETFTYVSFWEILKSIKAKNNGQKELISSDFFKDKIVYIGTNVFALSDIKTVPTSKYFPGVEIHATLFNNILDNNVIHKADKLYNAIILLFMTLAAVYTVFKIRSVYVSVSLFVVLLLSYLYFSTYVMTKYNVWIWVVVPILLSLFVFVCSFIIKYLIKSRDFEYTYKLATTDGLTELYNHRFFQEQMKFKIVQADKFKTKFSLILIDIDFFKKFNDKYGHQAGDAVLKQVAKTLKSCVRHEDIVCRYGGEEMAIILNNTDKEKAVEIANKICKTVAEKDFQLSPDLSVQVTISLGVATYPDNGEVPAALIEYSDKCLYKAKENGRNQVGLID